MPSAPTPPAPLFGSHLSIAGAMANALREAERLTLDCVQVFTKNQQQWVCKPLDAAAARDWSVELDRLGWSRHSAANGTPARDGRAVSHASYLINLASPDDELWKKSIDLMHIEIERCEQLGIPFLVHHPGAFTTSTLDQGLARIAEACRELFRRTRGYTTVSLLENTAGGGSTIGRTFEELCRLRALIAEATGDEHRIGFCFDTCHAHAAGYDMGTFTAASAALDELDRICGLAHVRVLHLNDSKGKVGSRLDRHEHVGAGTIGLEGFRAVVARPELRGRPKILETPKGSDPDGTNWDTLNLRRLRDLAGSAQLPASANAAQDTPGVTPAASQKTRPKPKAEPAAGAPRPRRRT